MRVLIRLPNWIGDAVMATPALNNLVKHFQGAGMVLVGSPPVVELFREDPRFEAVIPDASKQQRFRFLKLTQLARRISLDHGPFEYGFAFPYTFSGRWILYAAGAWRRAGRKRGPSDLLLNEAIRCVDTVHQAVTYNQIVNGTLQTRYETGPATLHVPRPQVFPRPTIGINPGAAYGSAKRWLPERFADVAASFAHRYDIVITGGPKERETAAEIASRLQRLGIRNWQNTAGETTVGELVSLLSGLDLLVTNDSGPMHIGGALGIPLVAIFGPTDFQRTRPWAHEPTRIVSRAVPCAPCHRRTCPLEHHACMREISAEQVIEAAWSLVDTNRVAAAG